MAKADGFTSRWGFILAALGAAIGTGNIWRFPKEAATNGGGAFLILYILFLFLWAIPLLLTEFAIGRRTRLGTVGSFKLLAGKKFAWMGAWLAFISGAIGFYYAVVMGWTLKYLTHSITSGFRGTDPEAVWADFIMDPFWVIFFQIVALLISTYIIYKGVAKGIERVNKVLIPAMFAIIIFMAIWSLVDFQNGGFRSGALNGLEYLFLPKFSYFKKPETWISALAQVAWSCSAGMGMAITFGAYTKKREDTALNAFLTGLGDTSASLLVGVAVFCTVFAFSVSPQDTVAQAGAGMTFIQLPVLFAKMPGGNVIALLFFLAMAFAALTSMITTLEISTKNFEDFGIPRRKALLMISGVTFLLGIPSGIIVFNYTTGAGDTYPVTAFLDNQDTVWGTGLIISGLFITFLVWKYGIKKFREDIINSNKWNDIRIGTWYDVIIRFFFPAIIIILLVWYSYQTFMGETDTWWDSGPVGLMLIFGQWTAIIIILLLLNRWMVKHIPEEKIPPPDDDGPEVVIATEIVDD
jgi:NSS family neurotransmitter:Na+ symporter